MASVIVVMGVSASGKSLVGARLADRLGLPFREGDALHPAANIAKMAAGHPLDDADRTPWLANVATWIGEHPDGGVISCSALRRRYRDRLRRDQAVAPMFVLLDPPRAVLERRAARRDGHFMPASLLDSQLATLERPTPDEHALRLATDDPARGAGHRHRRRHRHPCQPRRGSPLNCQRRGGASDPLGRSEPSATRLLQASSSTRRRD